MPDLFQLPQVIPLKQGSIMPGSKLYFYQTGTSTPQAVYSDYALTTAITQPVTADANGIFQPIYLDPNGPNYRVTLKDSAGVTQSGYPIDNIPALSIAGNQQYGVRYALALGTANAIQVTLSDPDVTSYYSGLTIIIGDNVGNTSSAVSINVNGLGARDIYHLDGTSLFAGEITGGSTIIVTYSELTSRFEIVSAIYSSGIVGSFTAGLTGLTTFPIFTMAYRINNGTATLYPTINQVVGGTSNTDSFTITGLPSILKPSANKVVYLGLAVDGGTPCTCQCEIDKTTGVITLYRLKVSGTAITPDVWQTSGLKQLYNYYTMTYAL